MVWIAITRPKYRLDRLRYASDTTEKEWAVIVAFMPSASRRGRPRTTALRAVTDAIFYIAQTGCQWRLLPKEFPPYTTVQRYFYQWRDDGTRQKINHYLAMLTREAEGREASPTIGVIDSQSVKTTEAGGPRGFDAGKKIKGRKQHLLTDTAGILAVPVPFSGCSGTITAGTNPAISPSRPSRYALRQANSSWLEIPCRGAAAFLPPTIDGGDPCQQFQGD